MFSPAAEIDSPMKLESKNYFSKFKKNKMFLYTVRSTSIEAGYIKSILFPL